MEKEYLKGVTIRDLKEEDRKKLDGLGFDYMLANNYKIIEKDNLFAVINNSDYKQYGKERLCDVIYIEHSNIIDEDFLRVDFAKIANDINFNKPLTIEVEFICNKHGSSESIFKAKDKAKYYIRMDVPNQHYAEWYSAFKKDGVFEDSSPIRANVTFKMGDETEKVTFSNWNAEGVYSKDYNKAFSYDELNKLEISNNFKELAKKYKFKTVESGNDIILCAKNTDKEWAEWITYNKDNNSVSVVGNTDQCNFWFYDTRKDLTPEKIIDFVNELNAVFEKTHYEIPLRTLIDPEDWQEIAKVEDAYTDSRYTGSYSVQKDLDEPDYDY